VAPEIAPSGLRQIGTCPLVHMDLHIMNSPRNGTPREPRVVAGAGTAANTGGPIRSNATRPSS